MRSLHTLDDDFSGPEPLIRALEATPCRRALVVNAGHIGLSPELVAYHKREAERLRQTVFRQIWRKLAGQIRKPFR